ncbi:MAG: VWA domain-containing protein [Methylococcaceae bacterium]|nr:VWA domain-containing protein [Methylococcaceae bacterium]
MGDFHFLRWPWLLALIPLLLLYRAWLRRGRVQGDWSSVCDPALLPHILLRAPGGSPRWSPGPGWGLTAAVLAVLALSGPVWEKLPTPAVRNQQALVLVLDLSPAMGAVDLSPTRMDRARFKITDILRQRKDGLTALVAFAGEAYTVTPLTEDSETIVSQLGALSPGLLPGKGSSPAAGLEMAGRILQQAGLVQGDVLLVSGSGDEGSAADTAAAMAAQGFRISVLAAGTEAGGPIALPKGGFLQSSQGETAIARLPLDALRKIAASGGGLFRQLSADGSDLAALLPMFERQAELGGGPEDSSIVLEQWVEAGIWLLIPLLPLAALAFRRGLIAGWLLLALIPLPRPAAAWEWQDLWQTRDQRAQRAFDAQDYGRAAETFEDPAWKAAAQYRAGQADQAAETLAQRQSADDHYNRGNALAKAKQYQAALDAYDRALAQNPDHDDARYNKELVEQALRQQQSGQDKNQNQDGGKDKKPGDGKDQQSGQGSGESRDNGQGQQDQAAQNGGKPSGQQQDDSGSEPGEDHQQAGTDRQDQSEHAKPAHADSAKPDDPQAGDEHEQAAERRGEQAGMKGREGEPEDAKQAAANPQSIHGISEDRQAAEQWLRRIPDDPGGLLKRKFLYQYQQRQGRRQP